MAIIFVFDVNNITDFEMYLDKKNTKILSKQYT